MGECSAGSCRYLDYLFLMAGLLTASLLRPNNLTIFDIVIQANAVALGNEISRRIKSLYRIVNNDGKVFSISLICLDSA